MPEGPSIIIAREALLPFVGKKILAATGSAPIDVSRLAGQQISEIRTWGKHLLLCFDGFTVRVHFLMFGTYYINSSKALQPRLALKFPDGEELNLYTTDVRMIDEPLDEVYDWSADIMSESWDPAKAMKKMKEAGDELIADVLMDQQIFSGLGNIIKNEVLYRARVHPNSTAGKIPPAQIRTLLRAIPDYAFEFLLFKKAEVLSTYWEVYTKKICARDGAAIKKNYMGRQKRRCFFCDVCQIRY